MKSYTVILFVNKPRNSLQFYEFMLKVVLSLNKDP